MAYIFLDESGDLGFNFKKKKTSHYFVVTLLFAKDKNPIEKIVKKIFKKLSPKERRAHGGVLHCFKEHPKTRQQLLASLLEKNISIVAIYMNKKKVYTRLQEAKQALYNYVVNILLDRIYTRKLIPTNMPIELVAAQRETNKFLNQNFKSYLARQTKDSHKADIKVEIRTPHQEKSLQAVDFVAWAIFRKYEHNDEGYYQIIKPRIVEENPLFP